MARLRIIVLDRSKDDLNQWRCAFWADVPAARQALYANKEVLVNGVWTLVPRRSAWRDALTADNTALDNGSMTELVDTVSVDPTLTVVQIEALLQTRWQAFQDQVNIAAHPWKRYGSTWDGTTWTITNIS